MKQKEYPMDENYNQALKFLTEQIAERDKMRKQLKIMPPAARPNGLRLLSELTKAIERGEKALAKEYEAHQNHQRALEAQEKTWQDALHAAAGSLIHVKYRLPDKFDEAFDIFTKGWSNEELEAFEDRIAIMEAGDLVRIIRREGETRAEAEEFLKNFRRQEEEERAALFEEFLVKFSAGYVHDKYRQPEMRAEFDEVLSQLKPEQIQEFHDLVAHLEAHNLIECITVKGETPEETEEFLKNYRAAEAANNKK